MSLSANRGPLRRDMRKSVESFMRAITRRCCATAVFAALAFAAGPAGAREVVSFGASGYSAGTIVVRTTERRLYLVLGNGQAIRYMVGVGRAGRQWAGVSRIDGKYLKPAWAPPPEI